MTTIGILKEPMSCIYCGSNSIEATEAPHGANGTLDRKVVCSDCDRYWVETFKIWEIYLPDLYFGQVSLKASERYGMRIIRKYDQSDIGRAKE